MSEKPNRDELLEFLLEMADDLSACLDGLEFVHRIIPQARQQVEDATGEQAADSGGRFFGTLGDFRIAGEIRTTHNLSEVRRLLNLANHSETQSVGAKRDFVGFSAILVVRGTKIGVSIPAPAPGDLTRS